MFKKIKSLPLDVKLKLVYSGEIIAIALIALVIGVLKIVGVIPTKPTRLLIYNIISLLGACYLLFDFVWIIVSKKHRAKSCLLDKITVLPMMGYIFAFDVICFIDKANGVTTDDNFVKYSVGAILISLGALYIFQGIYHYFKPTPQVIELIEDTERQLQEAEEEEKNNFSKMDTVEDAEKVIEEAKKASQEDENIVEDKEDM